MSPTRRQVLAASAGVAVAGGLGAGTMAWRWWERPPGAGLAQLATDEHAFVQALAEAWMPKGGEPSLSGADAALGDFFDGIVDGMHPSTGRELRLLLAGLDALTLPTHLARYHTLGLGDRQDVLRSWLHSDITLLRSGVHAVVALVSLGWTSHPDVAERLRPYFRCGYSR